MNNYKIDIWNSSIQSNFVMNPPVHYVNRFKIFEFARRSIDEVPSEKQGGVSTYDKWKLNQPGFMEHNLSSLSLVGSVLKKNKEITWDGT